jgi:hypothetical protein
MGLLVLGAASMACAQPPPTPHRGAQVLLSSGGLVPASVGRGLQGEPARGEIVREIDDPNLGDRWLLMRNDEVPGGPGRLVLVAAHRQASGGALLRARSQTEEARLLPIIRAGDRVTVEEHTAHVDALLDARALSPAAAGSALDARLAIGGRVVRAVALGPGRAVLQPETEGRP